MTNMPNTDQIDFSPRRLWTLRGAWGVGLLILTYTLIIAKPDTTPCREVDPWSAFKAVCLVLAAIPLLGTWVGMFRLKSPKAFLSAVRGATLWPFFIGFPALMLVLRAKGDLTILTGNDLPALFVPLSQMFVFFAALACLFAVRTSQKLSLWYGYGRTVMYALILGLILAVTMPSMVSLSPISSNQRAAVGNLRSLHSAQMRYESLNEHGYAPTLKALSLSENTGLPMEQSKGLIDEALVGGEMCGYRFSLTPGPPNKEGKITSYNVTAQPLSMHETGDRNYFVDEYGVICYTDEDRPATNEDPEVGG